MKVIEEIKDEFSRPEALALIPAATGINFVGSVIQRTFQLPIFIDMIGTFFSAMLAGPWIAATGGALYNIMAGFVFSPTSIPYAIVNIVGGLVAGYLAMKGWFKTWPKTLASAGLIWVAVMLTTNPISAYLFGGVTGGTFDVLTGVMLATGSTLLSATFWGHAPVEIADKFLSVIIARIIAKSLPKRYATRYKYAEKILEK